jgi:hypothetical protein
MFACESAATVRSPLVVTVELLTAAWTSLEMLLVPWAAPTAIVAWKPSSAVAAASPTPPALE